MIPTEEQILDDLYERTQHEVRDFLDRYSLSPSVVNAVADMVAEDVVERWEPDLPDRHEEEEDDSIPDWNQDDPYAEAGAQ